MNLENIKVSELPSVYLLDKNILPNCAAIYFVSESKGQIIYIGRTVNLVQRWKDHHRFNQLKRFNRKNKLNISWFTCSPDTEIISNLENEFIKYALCELRQRMLFKSKNVNTKTKTQKNT
ncbi:MULTISPECIES: GIY-YIG nuclease family protein [unclassified Nodularia (in: cyanobacteria)]|uniref:GIY-YIG nuclease family protein n=1 Tax=unclassified Nodularia (in: cyanobacteria) TaxID=2656917 RepID=UPI00187F131F|nr:MULTISPECIES: GIY-YIG nuclease family protein [unclassified Nodularia (in: cyanobacteria)]MBE9200358.1 GIY-YIG nuclease family protein [Nodularia sp. LEGE 06071]MCC2695834.1 GIY-YIG nuclease family protein [Nodularia sp. LEGE 04288]